MAYANPIAASPNNARTAFLCRKTWLPPKLRSATWTLAVYTVSIPTRIRSSVVQNSAQSQRTFSLTSHLPRRARVPADSAPRRCP